MHQRKKLLLKALIKYKGGNILKQLEKDAIELLSDMAHNVSYNEGVKLTDYRKNTLAKYRRKLHTLVDKQTLYPRRKSVIQKGGALFPLIFPLLTSLIATL